MNVVSKWCILNLYLRKQYKGGAQMAIGKMTKKLILMLTAVFCYWLFLSVISGTALKGNIRIHLNRINTKQEIIELSLYDISEIMNRYPAISDHKGNAYTNAEIEMIEQEINRLNLVAFIHKSDQNQVVEWQELSRGTYLIIQPKAADFGKMEPILITLSDTQMNVVVEPAIIQTAADSHVNIDSGALIYLPNEAISLRDVFFLFIIFFITIIILSLWKYQREQRKA